MTFSHPDYTLIRELGHGGAASVHLAVQKSLERHVAIKMLHSASLRGDDAGARFLREARTVAMLEHRHIVPVYEVGRSPEAFGYFLTMEYLPGGTLGERRGDLTAGSLLRALDQVAAALACAHAKGIVHRDVKADNILFRGNGEAVLSDFGIARLSASETCMTMTGAILGTAAYMSPEQVRGETLDGRSDLYSLGIVLYEMLSGRRPFVGDSVVSTSLQHLTTPPPPLSASHAAFQPLVDRLLAKTPDERPASAEDLRAELRTIARTLAANGVPRLGEARADGGRTGDAYAVSRSSGASNARNDSGNRRSRRTLARAGLVATLAGAVAIGVVTLNAPDTESLTESQETDRIGGSTTELADSAMSSNVPPIDPLNAVMSSDRPPTESADGGDDAPQTAAFPSSGGGSADVDSSASSAASAIDATRDAREIERAAASEAAAQRERANAALADTRRALAAGSLEQAAELLARVRSMLGDDSRIDELDQRLASARASRVAARELAARRERSLIALADTERALAGGSLDRAAESLVQARSMLGEDARVLQLDARLAAARVEARTAEREAAAAAALDARIASLENRFDSWSAEDDATLDGEWAALNAELTALLDEHPEHVAVQRLARVMARQRQQLARASEARVEPVADETDRFHLPGF